jgi:hypothetical protein
MLLISAFFLFLFFGVFLFFFFFSSSVLCDPRRSEPAGAPRRAIELFDDLDRRRGDPLEHELRHAVAAGDGKVRLGVVEEHDADGAAVVGVDDPGTDVDKVLHGEPGARRDAAVGTWVRGGIL